MALVLLPSLRYAGKNLWQKLTKQKKAASGCCRISVELDPMGIVEVVSATIGAEAPISIIIFVDADAAAAKLLNLLVRRRSVDDPHEASIQIHRFVEGHFQNFTVFIFSNHDVLHAH